MKMILIHIEVFPLTNLYIQVIMKTQTYHVYTSLETPKLNHLYESMLKRKNENDIRGDTGWELQKNQ
ncbi:hypothetical protein AMD01_00075 [Priestia koreensis]|uniref:Uncharacterized protein n=1 Tax=Priestia koreensis TaxID=284581 RepID=A0A0M0LNV7_9BACI|nr:hypothetical protein AMD01_00075 [Priestia koreensis]